MLTLFVLVIVVGVSFPSWELARAERIEAEALRNATRANLVYAQSSRMTTAALVLVVLVVLAMAVAVVVSRLAGWHQAPAPPRARMVPRGSWQPPLEQRRWGQLSEIERSAILEILSRAQARALEVDGG
jgi:hypothetical protein